MKRFLNISLLLVASLCAAYALAATSPAKTTSRADRKAKQEEVLRVDRELNAALLRGDVVALEGLLSKSYTFLVEREVLLWNGGSPKPISKVAPQRKQSRDELLSGLKSGALKFSTLQWTSERASLAGSPNSALGEKAIVAGRMREKSTLNGKDTGGDFLLTRTYEKRDGRWLCEVAVANSVVEKE